MDELRRAWLKLTSHVDVLASERQHYLDFFEGADAAYLLTDRLGVIVEANGAAVDLLERRRYFLRGKPIAAMVPVEERHRFRDRLSGLVDAARWRGTVQARGGARSVEFSARLIPGRGVCWRLDRLQ
jgi:PAS domain-containing protein